MLWDSIEELRSSDNDVKKYVFKKADAVAEAVLYKYGNYYNRTVMCISTQTGCNMGCSFCGTGKFFGRSLTSEEIISQVEHLVNENSIRTEMVESFQIMFMSMGEPLLNMVAVATAIEEFNASYPEAALLISTSAPKSPAGWELLFDTAKRIDKVGLQFSVHESTDEARDKLIPYQKKHNLASIARLGKRFYRETGRTPFFNYCIHDENSSDKDITRLSDLFDSSYWQATISVICEADQTMTQAVSAAAEQASDFSSKLLERGFSVRVFNPAGQDDIGGGCGQLWHVQNFVKDNVFFRQSAGDKDRTK